MKRTGKKRYYIPVVFVLLIALCWPINVNACELLYVGGDMTDDGANLFMRTEEIYADDNKTYYVSPAGKHAKGEQ